MPMKLNVGASRKIADDHYGSRGASVNLEIELDSGLAADTAKLQERIRQLFNLVRQSLAEELNNSRNGPAQMPANGAKSSTSQDQPTNGRKQNNRQQNGVARYATPAQVKALYAISKQQGADLHELLRERYSLQRPAELLLKQASELIDSLKAGDASSAA